MTLKDTLQQVGEDFLSQVDEETERLLKDGIEDLQSTDRAQEALGEGDSAPPFTLDNTDENPVSLEGFLSGGPLIITFYRGVW